MDILIKKYKQIQLSSIMWFNESDIYHEGDGRAVNSLLKKNNKKTKHMRTPKDLSFDHAIMTGTE